MLHTAKNRDECHLKTLHHCDIRNIFRIVTISTMYRFTSDIDIVQQGIPNRSKNILRRILRQIFFLTFLHTLTIIACQLLTSNCFANKSQLIFFYRIDLKKLNFYNEITLKKKYLIVYLSFFS